jgi:hypothetical protein
MLFRPFSEDLFEFKLIRNAELLATFCSASIQYCSTAFGFHTCSEPVLILSLTYGWLESPFHLASILRTAKILFFLLHAALA